MAIKIMTKLILLTTIVSYCLANNDDGSSESTKVKRFSFGTSVTKQDENRDDYDESKDFGAERTSRGLGFGDPINPINFDYAQHPIPEFPHHHDQIYHTKNSFPKDNFPIPDNNLNKLSETVGELEQIIGKEFEFFKAKYNKYYSTVEEELLRKEIFIENRKKIKKMNDDYGSGKSYFVLKVNEFTDLLSHEFNQLYNGFNKNKSNNNNNDVLYQKAQSSGGSTFLSSANVALPRSVDWRELGAVTSVKNQNKCGACYAFSAAGSLEGQLYRKTGILRELSVQNLIDCTKKYGNDGCKGGAMDPAFEYVRDNPGIEEETTYPFEYTDTQQCRYNPEEYAGHDTGYVLLDEGDERGLEDAVATVGPISSAIDATLDSFQFYSDGIFFDPKCQNDVDKMNHAVLVVGYGTESDGRQYWIVKNSYGPEWGIGGYMKLAKFQNNHCGIATYSSYPLV